MQANMHAGVCDYKRMHVDVRLSVYICARTYARPVRRASSQSL